MNGIVRHAFARDAARLKVNEAVQYVDALAISQLVATDNTEKQTKINMVHALLLWRTETPSNEEDGKYNLKGKVTYSLVSGYASKSVAQKLVAVSEMADLRLCLQKLPLVAGAEGYRGALFEAFAIKSIREGGELNICDNRNSGTLSIVKTLTVPRLQDAAVITLPNNELSTKTLPLEKLLKEDSETGRYEARLVWPETSNFPAFDAIYLDENGEMYSLQMTVAEVNSNLKDDLNNAGAYQAKVYLDKVAEKVAEKTGADKTKTSSGAGTSAQKHKAIFVTPGVDSRCWPQK